MPFRSKKMKRKYNRMKYLNKKLEKFKAAGIDDIQMEYNKNGELTEVYYYNKVVLNAQEGAKQTEQSETVEFRMPRLALKKKLSKYKRPKVPPKNPLVVLRHEWKEAIFNGHVIQCPNYEQCQFQTSSAKDMEYHYLKCTKNAIVYTCACGKFYTKRASFVGHTYMCGEAFKCRVCGKTFFNRKCLLNHLVQCQQASGAQDKTLGFGVESFSEVCSVCGDEFVNNEDLLRHISVMHPGQEVPSTSMSDVPCGSQQNNDAPGTSITKGTPVLIGPKFVSLKQKWQEKSQAEELIECPNYKECFFSCYTVSRMERHYVNCGRGFDYWCPCGRFFRMKYSYVKHQCPCNKVLYCEQCDKQYYSRNGYQLQIGKRLYCYCETCGEDYADNLDDYDPEDFVTLLSDNRVALKFVPQESTNSLSNETALHESEDDDIEPDVDTSQQFTSITSPLTSVHSSLTSTAEDVTMPSTAAASVSLSAPSQISTSSSLLISSQDSDSEMKEVTSSEEDSLCEENSSLEESLVVSLSHPPTASDYHYIDCIASAETMTASSRPVPSTEECSNVPSSSYTPAAGTTDYAVTPADSHTIVEEAAVSDTPLSSSIALPDITNPLDNDMDTTTPGSSTATGVVPTAEGGGNSGSCRRNPARHAKLIRASYTDKEDEKVLLYRQWRGELRENGYIRCPMYKHCGRECKSVSGMKYHYPRCGNITCSLCNMTFTVMAKFNAHYVMCHSNSSSKGESPENTEHGTSAIMREQTVDLSKTFQNDLKSIGSRSGPLPLWLWKRIQGNMPSRGDVTKTTPMASLAIQSQDDGSEDELETSLVSSATSRPSSSAVVIPATVGATPTVSSAAAVNIGLQEEEEELEGDKIVEQGERLPAWPCSAGVRKDNKEGRSEGKIEKKRKREPTDDREKSKKLKISNYRTHATDDGTLYCCKTCSKSYTTISSLYNHMEVCNKVLVCRTCGRQYHSRSGLANHELRCALTGGLPSIYCDICGKVFKCREELVEHHSIAHNKPPPQVQPLYQTNGINSGNSIAVQQDAVSPAALEDQECEVETSGDKSGAIADNAAQRNGSLTGIVERDRRKLEMKLLLSYWRAELRLNGFIRCPMYKYCGCHCSSINGIKYHYPRCGTIACPQCEKTFTTLGKFHAHFIQTHYDHVEEFNNRRKKKNKDQKTQDNTAESAEFGNGRRVLPFPQLYEQLYQTAVANGMNSNDEGSLMNNTGSLPVTGDSSTASSQHYSSAGLPQTQGTGFPFLIATISLPINRISKQDDSPASSAVGAVTPAVDKTTPTSSTQVKNKVSSGEKDDKSNHWMYHIFSARRKKKEHRKAIARKLLLAKKKKAMQLETEVVNVPMADMKNQTRSAKGRLQSNQYSEQQQSKIQGEQQQSEVQVEQQQSEVQGEQQQSEVQDEQRQSEVQGEQQQIEIQGEQQQSEVQGEQQQSEVQGEQQQSKVQGEQQQSKVQDEQQQSEVQGEQQQSEVQGEQQQIEIQGEQQQSKVQGEQQQSKIQGEQQQSKVQDEQQQSEVQDEQQQSEVQGEQQQIEIQGEQQQIEIQGEQQQSQVQGEQQQSKVQGEQQQSEVQSTQNSELQDEQQNNKISPSSEAVTVSNDGSISTLNQATKIQADTAYCNLYSLITTAAVKSQGPQLNSVMSLARAVKHQVSKDDSLTPTSGTSHEDVLEESPENSLIDCSHGDASQQAAASFKTPNPTLVRMSLFKVVQDETADDDAAVLHEGDGLVAARRAHYVIKHLLNTVMCQLSKDSNQLKLDQPSLVTPLSGQSSNYASPAHDQIQPHQTDSTASPNSKSRSIPHSKPSFTPHSKPNSTPHSKPNSTPHSKPSSTSNSKPGSTPNSKPSSISNLQTVTKAQTKYIVNPLSLRSAQVSDEQPKATKPSLRFPDSCSTESAVFYTKLLYDRLLQQHNATSSFAPFTTTCTTTTASGTSNIGNLPISLFNATNILTKATSVAKVTSVGEATSVVAKGTSVAKAKVTNVVKATSTTKVTNHTTNAAERKRRKPNDPRRTSQSVLDMERASPDSSYVNTNTAAMRSTDIFSTNDFTVHHMIPDRDHIPEVNFCYRQSARQLCQVDTPTCADVSNDNSGDIFNTTITSAVEM